MLLWQLIIITLYCITFPPTNCSPYSFLSVNFILGLTVECLKVEALTLPFSNLDEFSENFQRGKGGGVISDPKSFVADFCGNFKGGKQ